MENLVKKSLSTVLLLLFLGKIAFSSDTVKFAFFPDTRQFPFLFLDPMECQFHGGQYIINREGDHKSDIYSIVNMGISRPVLHFQPNNVRYELSLDVGSFTQFEIERIDKWTSLGGLMNNDFRVGAALNTSLSSNYFRVRFFHISSHLGDDYIIRNNIDDPNDRSQNFEQLEFTFLKKVKNSFFYIGSGYVVSRYSYRKRMSAQVGGIYNFLMNKKNYNAFISSHIGILEEDNYEPSIRSAIGITYTRKNKPLARIWAEYYSGHLPYSTLDFNRVSWYGLAAHLFVF